MRRKQIADLVGATELPKFRDVTQADLDRQAAGSPLDVVPLESLPIRVVIAVDPGQRSGVAWIRGDGTTAALAVNHLDTYGTDDLAGILDSHLCSADVWCFACEKPVNRRGPWDAYRRWRGAAQALARQRARAAGVRYRKPQEMLWTCLKWRPWVGIPPRTHGDVAKEMALVKAAGFLFAHSRSYDEAEAICLGVAVAGRAKVHPEEFRWVP
jgi:hypothetical protein